MSNGYDAAAMADAGIAKPPGPEYTGRYLVLLDQDDPQSGLAALESGAGVSSAEHIPGGDAGIHAFEQGGSVVLDDLGVAIVAADPDQRSALEMTVASTPSLLAAEPERVLHAYTASLEYLDGYRQGVIDAVGRASGNGQQGTVLTSAPAAPVWVETQATWGLQAILATETVHTGVGIGVAILDTGVHLSHPDLAGRIAQTASFVPGETVEDGHGHGTHCVGTSCGPQRPASGPRYGVACEADIYVGKVLSNQGRGSDGQILQGINWAVSQKAVRVVSMSLGGAVALGAGYSRIYERAARRALKRGVVIVAAAGNESMRPGSLAPVGQPANCPSILAVGAIAKDYTIAPFSCAGLNPNGGAIDLVAPGVDVLSAWRGGGYRRLSGTSMATPHVAGVTALLCEQTPGATASEIMSLLRTGVRDLGLPVPDGGKGLVQAP